MIIDKSWERDQIAESAVASCHHSMRRTVNHPQLSVQLYTVREAMQEDLPGTLARIAGIGFSQVEPYNFPAFPGLGDALRAAGLTAPTTHAHFVGVSDSELDDVFAAAKTLGIARVIDPHVPAERWQTAASVAEIAAQLNAAALVAERHGVTIGYHNHAHEAESVIDGRTALELLADDLDSRVGLEVDTYWAAVGGQDAAALLERLGSRVVAIHVKDGAATPEPKDQTAVGSGTLPIRRILEAAPTALRVIELDDSRGDRFQAIVDSYNFLVKENLA
jgi:sugar phosphate isomerase/epimerase